MDVLTGEGRLRMNRKRRGFGRVLALILILASVLLFSSLGYQFFRGRPEEEVPIVGVIQVTGAIISTEGTGLVTTAINRAISKRHDQGELRKIRAEVRKLCEGFPLYPHLDGGPG